MPHPYSPSPIHDVIIAGAGPVGLLLACELCLQGVAVLVLERATDPHTPLKALPFGLRGLTVPSIEALHRRGLLDELLAIQAAEAADKTAAAAHWLQQPRRPAGHFAGIQFYQDDVDNTRWPYHLPGPAGNGIAVTMQALETVLTHRAVTLGVAIRRGAGVAGFSATDDGVTVHAGNETFHASWLVGCDGGRSTVRKAGGFEFAGTDAEFTGYSIEAELADPHALQPGRHHTANGMYTYAQPGTIALVDFDSGACHRSQPVTLAHAQAVLRRVSGTSVTLTALKLAATWTDRARQAKAYRHGRVLLAGDAAHIHSPLGGQGLNLGLGDAMNLGWKLAAAVRGDAPPGLLDSYHAERHPVGAQVLDWSRAQVALMRPDPGARALAAVMRELIATRDGATYCAERISAVTLRHDLGGDYPLIGRSMPDFEFADGTRAGTLLRNGRGLLLDFSANTSLPVLAARWGERIDHVARVPEDALGLQALLVRPDGVVAWVDTSPDQPQDLAAAITRWFGEGA
ncbi:2-polyprenyl-6-methoxyphenol hydroxylase [Andreprevotia lacus DSM 23236]|jgi:2-polyprenyl-6-methoxyphenol hydroxylase-like FAD-dependent oxidoreductase|uniref:2-polyprenyl-6-methoxyphenol hydroxylase n=1 Tax=Andreprevotia lacus DSM 23236 TaxID=1121001 RepID=A0A1W1XVQ6_9NEIS|nr:FAD-dependent monooxygenase [Andreprevotia lacus]SMC27914.1 2-polyprenyl-6-methoxyphenol hydroxylase [Andreprevotia lacus DSM 23236]